ncbi:HesB/IscA family protein [Deminuibacter soli]|uniref:Iron-sulfur cluster assembly accessory protein n=1 Tax=Deminuibacter soli TaxID=2291815 RepID=A0A3E1NKM0_9BACT|nr:iron-sulfur cluster assembly accessory protein [Deminuibacter soli]RFM28338.1 iron-sulfur cluster assembly accessory protein [Deminuibacter soli]
METTAIAPVSITPLAVEQLKKWMDAPGFDTTQRVRVGVKGAGCSGMGFVLGFDHPQTGDMLFECEGLPCVINAAQQLYVFGMQIDWQDNEHSRGFTFSSTK